MNELNAIHAGGNLITHTQVSQSGLCSSAVFNWKLSIYLYFDGFSWHARFLHHKNTHVDELHTHLHLNWISVGRRCRRWFASFWAPWSPQRCGLWQLFAPGPSGQDKNGFRGGSLCSDSFISLFDAVETAMAHTLMYRVEVWEESNWRCRFNWKRQERLHHHWGTSGSHEPWCRSTAITCREQRQTDC